VREIEIAGAQRIITEKNPQRDRIKNQLDGERGGVGERPPEILSIFIKHVGSNDVGVQFRVEPIDERRGTAAVVYTINKE